jgi:hypothetical protein
MSKYDIKPFDLQHVQNYPLKDRSSKVGVRDFCLPIKKSASLSEFLQSLPAILGAQKLKDLAMAIVNARKKEKSILWGMGGHIIKTGLSPVLIDLMDRGFITCLALNGSCLIHDFEIAMIGSTSEDVEVQLQTGAFGMAEETGYEINQAIKEGIADGLGIGESLGRHIAKLNPGFGAYSLLLQAYLRKIPVTVHVTIGADIIHNHPNVSPADIGEGSHRDFRLFASMIANMNDGGVYLNCGSAVTLPEVFLKCVTLVRNSGCKLQDFTTANLDFIQHYRPTENVIKRPVLNGGYGIPLTGHHEIMIPLLAAWVLELSDDDR